MSNQHSNQKIIKLVDSPEKNKMNSKLYALNKDEAPDDNIFSKVLSGMKSVFNKPKKNKPKKSPPSERRTSREASSTKKLNESISSLNSLSSNLASELTIKDTDISIGSDDPDIEISTDETDFATKNHEETEKEEVPDYVLYTEDPDVPQESVEITVKEGIIPEAEDAGDSLVEVIQFTESVEVEDEIIPPVEEIAPSIAMEVEEPKAASSTNTPEKEGTSESGKHHKSKHTPKKKSRKKTKSRESDERHASDTDEVSDSIPKVESISILEKSSQADPKNKPRIVLTFRSEKTGLRSTNMKIVSDNEKACEESTSTSRRSLRNKIALTGTGISDPSIDDKKETKKKSSPVEKQTEIQTDDKVAKGANSESDDSTKTPPTSRRNKRHTSAAPSDSNSEDSPPVTKDGNIKRSARYRPKEQTDTVLANAMARKEKIFNEPSTSGTTRLSRRIKPTAKVLANRELRMGFETQNVARLALSTEVPLPEEFKVTRSRLKRSPEKPNKISIMTAPKSSPDKNKKKKAFVAEIQEKKSADSEKPVKQAIRNQSMDELNRFHTGKAQSLLSLRCQKFDEDFNAMTDENSDMQAFFTEEEREKRRLHKLKKKHLKKLGLKAVTDRKKKPALPDREVVTDESTMDSTNTEAIVEHLNTRSKSFDFGSLSQAESFDKLDDLEDALAERDCSDEDFVPSDEEVFPRKDRKRKVSSDIEDNLPIVQLSKFTIKLEDMGTLLEMPEDYSSLPTDAPPMSENFVGDGCNLPIESRCPYNDDTDSQPSVRMTRKRSRMKSSATRTNAALEANEVNSPWAINPDEGNLSAANQPVGSSTGLQACLCRIPSNVYLEPSDEVADWCKAVDWVGGRALGCNRMACLDQPLLRSGHRAPYFLACDMHRQRLLLHHCCAGCGAFCTQGIFFQCSLGHLFHWECGLPFVSVLLPPSPETPIPLQLPQLPQTLPQPASQQPQQPQQKHQQQTDVYGSKPGCPHCGLLEDTLQPRNTECFKVNVEMRCTVPNALLPYRLKGARMTFNSGGNIGKTMDVEQERVVAMIEALDIDLPILPPDLVPNMILEMAKLQENKNKPIDYDEILMKEDKVEKMLLDEAICLPKNATIEAILAAIVGGEDPRKPTLKADGGTCFHLAARELNLSALHIFKALGCQLDGFDSKHRTPLMVAIIGYGKRVRELEGQMTSLGHKDYNASVMDPEPTLNLIRDAIKETKEDYYNVVRYLCKAGCDVSLKGPEGVSALHLASKSSDARVYSCLLESHRGASKLLINQQDDGGWTPLVWAAENNNVGIVRFLLDSGADPMVRDKENNVALHWSTVSGCSRSLEALLNAGSYVNIPNCFGDTPLHVCARQNHYSCIVLLLARGALVNVKNTSGHTPLDLIEDESCNSHSILAVNKQLQGLVTTFGGTERIVSNDISNGKELNPVQCVNGWDFANMYSDFTYITDNCFTTDILVDRKITSMEGCDCTSRCGQADAQCACSNISVQSWYEPGGKLVPHFDYDDPPMIFECNDVCNCNKKECLNRCVGRGSQAVLQVFRCSEGRGGKGGWGVRAATDISRGQFVAEYVGEVLASGAACTRRDDAYLFQMEVKDSILEDDGDMYCIDARRYGNVSRFINHKCSPSLVPVRVYTSHRDLRFPRIAFFACRDIPPGEELGFDYGEKFWAVKRKSFNCQCGSPDCRYPGNRQEQEDEEPEPELITVDEALDTIDDDVYDDEMEDNGEDIVDEVED